MAGAFSTIRSVPMKPVCTDTAHNTSQGQTVEVRARLPVALRDQLEQLAARHFRSMAGELAAATTAWIQQHSHPA